MGEIIPLHIQRPLPPEAKAAHDERVSKIIRETIARRPRLVALSDDDAPESGNEGS